MRYKIHKPMSNEKAFTLIEVIICLVLVGIMTAIAGMGLIQVAEGYVFAKQNAETAQKAQVAIARIVKELGTATAITSATTSATQSISYTRAQEQEADPVTNTIAFTTPNITVHTTRSGSPGEETTLLDNVETFDLEYCNGTAVNVCNPTKPEAPVRRIVIKLTVSGQTFDSNVFMKEF
jgi:prepilin-type N-terminal cleavage/methylation domain-containing protein